MYHLHKLILNFHIILGAATLVIFWLPVITKKGSKMHINIGKIYTYSMYAISISGIFLTTIALIDPIGVRVPNKTLTLAQKEELLEVNRNLSLFLMMLSFLILTNVRHSILVLKAKKSRSILKSWSHVALVSSLTLLAIIVNIIGWLDTNWLLIIFSGISLFSSYGMWHYLFKSKLKQREWIIEHLNNILASGIGLYTAFFAVGGRHLMSEILPGSWQILAWITPAIVGVFFSVRATKKFEQKYKVS
jgi:hypothetical protein